MGVRRHTVNDDDNNNDNQDLYIAIASFKTSKPIPIFYIIILSKVVPYDTFVDNKMFLHTQPTLVKLLAPCVS